MNDAAALGDLAVGPFNPFRVGEHLQNGPAFVGVAPAEAVDGVRADRVKKIASRTPPSRTSQGGAAMTS